MKLQANVINRKLNSFSIIEVLVALIIVGFLFTSFIGLAGASLMMAKNNEVEDVSMSALLKAKDLVRTSNVLGIEYNISGPSFDSAVSTASGTFLAMDSTGIFLIPATNASIIYGDDSGTNCTDSSLHEWISTQNGNTGYKVCVQIYMKKKSGVNGVCYGIKVVSEKAKGEYFIERLYGYKIGSYSASGILPGSPENQFRAATGTDPIITFCN